MSQSSVIYDSAYQYARKTKKWTQRASEAFADKQVKEYEKENIEKLEKQLEGVTK